MTMVLFRLIADSLSIGCTHLARLPAHWYFLNAAPLNAKKMINPAGKLSNTMIVDLCSLNREITNQYLKVETIQTLIE